MVDSCELNLVVKLLFRSVSESVLLEKAKDLHLIFSQN